MLSAFQVYSVVCQNQCSFCCYWRCSESILKKAKKKNTCLLVGYIQNPCALHNWLVVSNIFYFHPYLGKIPNLTNIFQMGWNHQLESFVRISDFEGLKIHSVFRQSWKTVTKKPRFWKMNKIYKTTGTWKSNGKIWVFPTIGGKPPKMDGENNGKPVKTPIKMNDLGVPLFSETSI